MSQFALLPSKEKRNTADLPIRGKEDIPDMPVGYANQLAMIKPQLDSRLE